MSKQPIESWLKTNCINLLITFAGIVSAFAVANYRINAMELKIAQYPSYDYFNLRFSNLEKDIGVIQKTLNTHMGL